MFKRMTAILLIITLVFAMSVPVLAQTATVDEDEPGFTTISGTYLLDGVIDWRIHAGGVENGAQQKSIITGEGVVDRTFTMNISLGKLEVTEATYLKSVNNLKMISVTKVGMSPTDATYNPTTAIYSDAEDQIYAFYLKPDAGEFASVEYGMIATHGHDYIDSFFVKADMVMSDGLFARYISMSSGTAKSPYVDDLSVDGSASVTETFEMLDVIKPLKSTIDWYNLF